MRTLEQVIQLDTLSKLFLRCCKLLWLSYTVLEQFTMISDCIEQKGQKTKAVDFEEAMTKAFSEIFHNLKEIEADAKKQKEKVDRQRRRRQSAPASMIRELTETLRKPEKESKNTMATQPSLSTMHWILDCYDEEEHLEEDFGSDELSISFLHSVIIENHKTAPK